MKKADQNSSAFIRCDLHIYTLRFIIILLTKEAMNLRKTSKMSKLRDENFDIMGFKSVIRCFLKKIQ